MDLQIVFKMLIEGNQIAANILNDMSDEGVLHYPITFQLFYVIRSLSKNFLDAI